MNYSEEYLNDKFKKSYDDALRAYKYNNLPLAKEKFIDAASYLEQLANCFTGSKKDEYLQKSKRVKKVADAIILAPRNDFNTVQTSYNNSQIIKNDITKNSMSEYITFYTAEELNEGFESVIGLEEVKKTIINYVVNPIKFPEAYNYKFLNNKAVLLEGPPGTGKTTFAKAIAKEINQPFALINVASLVNCYIGETGKNIDKVFQYLRDYVEKNKCGITVFFDELDEIAKKRGGDDKTSESAVPALLRNLDGVRQNKNFLIIANTNLKDALDEGIKERFRQKIHIPLPNKEERKQLFKIKLSDVESKFLKQINFDKISDLSDGLSGRDITYICDDLKYELSRIKAYNIEDVNILEVLTDIINKKISQK